MTYSHKEKTAHSNRVQDRIQEHARKFGNKAANLQELASVCSGNIPSFCPLSDDLIKAHLNKYAPKWDELWNKFKVEQGNEKSEIRKSAIPALQALRELMMTTFNEHPVEDPDLLAFLDTIKQKNATLMVRSTGEEDTVDVANPGGNESVAAIAPTIEAVSAAMGTVVASYFSEKSLKQRLLSPVNDITKDTFVPVLLQQMIGEPMHGYKSSPAVIRSGVMYTGEGNTRIQVAPGHGELVVNSKGLFDTFSVTRNHVVYAEVARKPYRLVPTKNGLQKKKNPQILQDRASISQSVAQRIAQLGRDIEQHYGMPMDVEFVYDPKTDAVSIVQARPIPAGDVRSVIPSSVPPASVPALKQAIKTNQIKKIDAHVITPAGFAAKIITDPEQVLVCNTIEEALTQYLAQTNSPVQAVVVRNLAGTTSHEAAQFSSKAIPVLQVVDLSSVNESLKTKNSVLMVDPQRNQILDFTALVKDSKNAKNELNALNYLEEGIFTHPLAPITSQAVTDVWLSDQAMTLFFSKIDPNAPVDVNISTLIETLEAVPNPQALSALNSIRTILYHLKQVHGKQVTFFPQAMVLCEEIERSIARSSDREEHLSLVARLKSLIYAQANRDIFSNSMKQIVQETKSKQAIDTRFLQGLSAEQSDYVTQFLKLNKIAFRQEGKDRWTQFALDCVKDPASLQQLVFVVKFYIEHHLESDLINLDLQQALQSEPSFKSALQKLHAHCMQARQEFTNLNLDEKINTIHAWEQRIPEWSDVAKFDGLLQDYQKEIVPLISQLQITSPMDLVVMDTVPTSDNLDGIPGGAHRAVVISQGKIYIVNKTNKQSTLICDAENDFLKEYRVGDMVTGQHRSLSVREQSLLSVFDITTNKEWSLFYSSDSLTSEQMFSIIKTDFAYVLTGDNLYYINKKNNTCVISNMASDELETAKAHLIRHWNRKQKESGPVDVKDILQNYLMGQGVRKDHGFIDSALSLTSLKAILNVMLELTNLMDNTIKSLKSSPNYSLAQQVMMVDRFVTLLHPYYELMSQSISTIDHDKLRQLYPDTGRSYNHFGMLNAIREALMRPNREPQELNMSGNISVGSAKLGSYAAFARQFFKMKNDGEYVLNDQKKLIFRGTFEDLFSLIHQNILSAISIVRDEVITTPINSLPDELHPLLSAFAATGSSVSAEMNLLSVTHHFPMLTLEYNLPMANHSAKFIIEYNQNTRQVTLQGQLFGGNWQNRMDDLVKYINMDGLAFAVQVKKPPEFSEKTFCMDFVWEFPASRLQDISANLSHCFRSYDRLLSMSGSRYDVLSTRYQGLNMLESVVSQGRLELINEIKKMDSSWRNIIQGEIKLTHETTRTISNCINSQSDPDVVVFIMEKVAESNEPSMVQEFFNSLEVTKNPVLRNTRFMSAIEKSSVPAFKQAVDAAIQRQAEKKTAAIQTSQKYRATMDELKNQEQDAMKPSVFRPKSSGADSGDKS